jgi:hypothetical protein
MPFYLLYNGAEERKTLELGSLEGFISVLGRIFLETIFVGGHLDKNISLCTSKRCKWTQVRTTQNIFFNFLTLLNDAMKKKKDFNMILNTFPGL